MTCLVIPPASTIQYVQGYLAHGEFECSRHGPLLRTADHRPWFLSSNESTTFELSPSMAGRIHELRPRHWRLILPLTAHELPVSMSSKETFNPRVPQVRAADSGPSVDYRIMAAARARDPVNSLTLPWSILITTTEPFLLAAQSGGACARRSRLRFCSVGLFHCVGQKQPG